MSGYRVEGDADQCIASHQCSAVAPALFGHDEDGVVVVKDREPAEEHRESAEYAARICPSQAIRVLPG
ncbi:ferredoxin [Streptomyces umbrinus]|uniref:ferredoxin n=1 Tax=Streptomyces umbrinus TaxID=67370 RepID=UPI0016724071|nr:ferredoxin [Streptomyces umbrinus]GHB83039.1 ferredoxin [Streptomyces umbrinus]